MINFESVLGLMYRLKLNLSKYLYNVCTYFRWFLVKFTILRTKMSLEVTEKTLNENYTTTDSH